MFTTFHRAFWGIGKNDKIFVSYRDIRTWEQVGKGIMYRKMEEETEVQTDGQLCR